MSTRNSQNFRANRTHARPTGPGELARARELRKRGLHLRLIEAWRPFPTQPELKRNLTMTEQELTSLRTVIRYLWRDEQKNFEDMEAAGDNTDDHVFRHLETLNHYLNRKPIDNVPSEQTANVSPFI